MNRSSVEDAGFDRETRLCDRMLRSLERDPEYVEATDRAIVIVVSGDADGMAHAGMGTHGYDNPSVCLVDMLENTRALADVAGLRVDFLGIDEDGITRFGE